MLNHPYRVSSMQ
ncbi:uncharacterized protein FFE2_11740 [Fusarium fujikuroi]|nr:uncharacterized protein FFE2_11740 [Fusarium fujikuroi]